MERDQPTSYTARQAVGLFVGLSAFVALLLLPAPTSMGEAAWKTAAVILLMGTWWVTEAVHIAVTALLPLVLFPTLGVLDARAVSSVYADHVIFLFLGGLFIASAMERWGLHRRVAILILSRVGRSPRLVILGFLVTTAGLSMWMSNTAATLIMLPIALAILDHASARGYETGNGFGTALMLGLAYSASIGGIATPVGTPPNAVLLGALGKLFPDRPGIGFLDWMLFGVPTAATMVLFAWFYLVYVFFRVPTEGWREDRAFLRRQLRELGPMSRAERRASALIVTVVLLWVSRGDLNLGTVVLPGWANLFPYPDQIQDSTTAIFGAVLLFLIPAGNESGVFLLDWKTAERIPWGVLVLLGGSLALAEGAGSSGLAWWVGSRLTLLGAVSPAVAICVVCLLMACLTEFTSNTATTTLMMPILAATAQGMGIDPLLLMVPGTLAASFGFMLPAGTPPNAIVFASGYLTIPQMFWAGLGLDLIGVGVLTLFTYVIGVPALDISLIGMPGWAR